MATAIAVGFIFTVIGIAALVFFIRAEVDEVIRTETHLHDPDTPTVAYAVPNGVDPIGIRTALRMDGFTCVPEQVGDAYCLLIECEPGDRERVRRAIAAVHITTYDGSVLQLDHVRFEDEH
jgi:hypothetical protein